jgi:hypothetical protein
MLIASGFTTSKADKIISHVILSQIFSRRKNGALNKLVNSMTGLILATVITRSPTGGNLLPYPAASFFPARIL